MARFLPIPLRVNSASGFTLIELLVAVAIIAILAAGSLYALNPAKRIGDSDDERRKTDLISISKAIEMYTADYGTTPSQLVSDSIASGQKYVLCSSAATLTCAGQTHACLVVTDSNFIGRYLPALPVDPLKTSAADTGYYITRSNTNSLILGSCSSYDTSASVQIASRVNLPAYVAQMTSQGPLSPSVAVNDATVGTYTWGTPEGVYTAGGSYAYNGSFGEVFHKVTKYIVATGYGFAIPDGATINGIVVEARKADTDDRADYDYAVRIVKGGAIGATDKSSLAQWSRSGLQYVTYGSSADLWGTTWSASDINASNFGFAISAYNDTGTWAPEVDHIRITVYYTP